MRLVRFAAPVLVVLAVFAYTALPGGGGGETEVADATHAGHLLAPSTQCRGQATPSLPPADQERVMLCMHNYARAKAGRRALRANTLLVRSSDAKTADILRCRSFSHTACRREMLFHVKRVGYTARCWGAGENLTWGSGSLGTVRARMRAWLESEPHRRNILNARFRDVGFGLRTGTLSGHAGARVWTAHFGYRC